MRLAGLELGGTKCIAVLGSGAGIAERRVLPTTTPAETLAGSLAVLREWEAVAPLAAIGVASFGPVRIDPAAAEYGRILATTKPGWSEADLLGPLRDAFGCPLALDTDVNGAALAEYRWGAGQGCSSLVYLTIGTGVGGGIAIDGRPVHGALHPELGHLRLRRAAGDTFAGTCSFHGDCIEGLVAGPALAARFDGSIHDAAPDDPRRDFVASDLAQLFAALILTLAPQKILVGGGVGLGVPGLLDAAIARLPALLGGYLPEFDPRALIAPPALGAEAGPLGALALAHDAAQIGHAPA